MYTLEDVKKAYLYAENIFDSGTESEIIIRSNADKDAYHVKKSTEHISKVSKFWSGLAPENPPIYFISVDENGKEFLRDQLNYLGFLDAMPSDKQWEENPTDAIFGSGGYSFLNNSMVLLYWQFSGSRNSFIDTGTIKTAPHLFTHSIQSALFLNSSRIMTDLPGWFVEGQADFIGLFAISESFDDYIHHRSNFFKKAYVPGQLENKKKIKNYTSDSWYLSLINSPEKFAGVKLVDEYYSGLLAYEFLLSKIGNDSILNLYKDFLDGEGFYSALEKYSGYSKEAFCSELSNELVNLSRLIVV